MALTGTLTDFGISDILQLIGQQQKTGILHLRNKDQEVHVHFVDGNVVKAEPSTRNRRDLLGNIMVRARALSQEDLERALEIQKRTLRRLGDVLVSERFVSREEFREMYQLQTTETLYKLFHWKAGTYEFAQEEVDWDQEAIFPIRSENVLMEGFRMVDEWPMIRKRITSYEMTFERLREAPDDDGGGAPAPAADFDADIDAAFGELEGEASSTPQDDPLGELGANERKVFRLAEPGATVQDLIDRSRLGEFETCKSLLNLVTEGFLKAIPPAKRGLRPLAGGGVDVVGGIKRAFAQLAAGVLALGGVAVLAYLAMGAGQSEGVTFTPRWGQEVLASAQLERLRTAVDLYRLEHGAPPERLEDLVDTGFVAGREFSYPYGRSFYYRRDETQAAGYVLLPPLP